MSPGLFKMFPKNVSKSHLVDMYHVISIKYPRIVDMP